ncbi:MAG: hypothetical protein HN348_09375 [Proteobacteria bacterium]|jgi:hypothetical protein|nr:hypothetical protein [Pseudomonadota bacterium]
MFFLLLTLLGCSKSCCQSNDTSTLAFLIEQQNPRSKQGILGTIGDASPGPAFVRSAWTTDGKQLFLGSEAGQIAIVDFAGLVQQLIDVDGAVEALEVSGDKQLLIDLGDRGYRQWNWENLEITTLDALPEQEYTAVRDEVPLWPAPKGEHHPPWSIRRGGQHLFYIASEQSRDNVNKTEPERVEFGEGVIRVHHASSVRLYNLDKGSPIGVLGPSNGMVPKYCIVDELQFVGDSIFGSFIDHKRRPHRCDAHFSEWSATDLSVKQTLTIKVVDQPISLLTFHPSGTLLGALGAGGDFVIFNTLGVSEARRLDLSAFIAYPEENANSHLVFVDADNVLIAKTRTNTWTFDPERPEAPGFVDRAPKFKGELWHWRTERPTARFEVHASDMFDKPVQSVVWGQRLLPDWDGQRLLFRVSALSVDESAAEIRRLGVINPRTGQLRRKVTVPDEWPGDWQTADIGWGSGVELRLDSWVFPNQKGAEVLQYKGAVTVSENQRVSIHIDGEGNSEVHKDARLVGQLLAQPADKTREGTYYLNEDGSRAFFHESLPDADKIEIWDVTDLNQHRTFAFEDKLYTTWALAPDGSVLAAATPQGAIVLYDVRLPD